jgi:Zn-dependent alcohol dehydrogenase
MKAVRLYGSAGNPTVSLEEVPVPRLGPGEILVRVHATAVTPGEFQWYPTWHTPKGDSRVNPVPGHEFSGVVETVASDVEGFAKGEAVYGLNSWFKDGAAAEYCITTPEEIAPKPETIDHVQAAVVLSDVNCHSSPPCTKEEYARKNRSLRFHSMTLESHRYWGHSGRQEMIALAPGGEPLWNVKDDPAIFASRRA